MVFSRADRKAQTVREACTVLRVEVIIFSWCSRGLPLNERNLKKSILSIKSSRIRRMSIKDVHSSGGSPPVRGRAKVDKCGQGERGG